MEHKVENWLRTNEAFQELEHTHLDSSPPSPSEGKIRKGKAFSPNMEPPPPGRAPPNAGDHYDQHLSKSVRRDVPALGKSFSSPIYSHLSVGVAEPHAQSSPVKPKTQQTSVHAHRKPDENAQLPNADASRPEYAISRSRGKATKPGATLMESVSAGPQPDDIYHPADASQSPQPRLKREPPNAEEEGGGDVEDMIGFHSASNDALMSVHTAQETALSSHKEVTAPSLTKEAMKSSMMTELPSAQVPQVPILPSLPSNLSSHDQMIQDSPDHNTTTAVDMQNVDRIFSTEIVSNKELNAGEHVAPHQEHIAPKKPQLTPGGDAQKDVGEDVTAHMIADAASVVAKTIKKSVGSVSQAASPIGVKKAGAARNRKRQTTMTEDQSRGSIKSALKVAKPPVTREDKLASKAALQCDHDQHSFENNLHERSPKVSLASAPKSILKSSLQHSTGMSVSNNAASSSTSKQDAQRQQKLNLVENDDEFDLDGALDELGSFLDTWDAEKQAAGVT